MKKLFIYLFPHQDDEIGVISSLINELRTGNEVLCFYLTKSSQGIDRDNESINYFKHMNIYKKGRQVFLGSQIPIIDQSLSNNLQKIFNYICEAISRNEKKYNRNITIIAPSFEGGHPDHDSAYVIALKIIIQIKYLKLYTFPLYHSEGSLKGMFNAFQPLKSYKNEMILNKPLNKDYIKLFSSLFIFKSQLITILVLSPFFLIRILVGFWLIDEKKNIIKFQIEKNKYKLLKPHKGIIYSEYRGWVLNYNALLEKFNLFLNQTK